MVGFYFLDYSNRKRCTADFLSTVTSFFFDNYIYILNVRFAGDINYEKDVDEGIGNFRIPSMILQPLVENAVIHGIFKRPEGGKIKVGLIEHPKYFKIYVLDTGVGIPARKRKMLLIDHKRRDQIGLINVHQRLMSLFGSACGLHIVSKENRGTLVFANIPKIEKAPASLADEEGAITKTIVLPTKK